MSKMYRTKPVVIEAVQWMGFNYASIKEFCGDVAAFHDDGTTTVLVISTLEGNMIATVGDFIIKGLRGEFYPCKEDVFHKKYEEIEA